MGGGERDDPWTIQSVSAMRQMSIMSNDSDGRQGSGRRCWLTGGLIGSRGSAGYLQGSLSGPINGLIVPLRPDKVVFPH